MVRRPKQVALKRQGVGRRPNIAGVEVVELVRHVDESGSLIELMRLLKGRSERWKNFDLAQVNFSEVEPGAIKAWHLHKRQDDVWFAAPGARLLLGLWDVRKRSPSKNHSQRILLGGGRSLLVIIPHGVAHGVANLGRKTGHLLYFLNQHYSPTRPDEFRLAWNALGKDFWSLHHG